MKTSNGVNKFPRQQSIFWIETDKIKPNSTQPRESFKEESLRGLADSIRQYGVLQPLVVTRREIEVPSGTVVEYELIAGERRLRASKMAELNQVPVIIREDQGEKVRLELAIIENLQREDLNPLEKARAFRKLIDSFNLKHYEIATKIGKSREYISNSLRILGLPEEIQRGLSDGAISEGHTRPLLMLSDRPQEQITLYKEIIYKKISVREAERISRSIAKEKARKKDFAFDQETRFLEEKLSEKLGTRVQIEKIGSKGRIHIDFFSEEELRALLDKIIEDDNQDSDEISEKDDLRNILYDEPINPLESEQPDDEDELTKNFTI